MLAYRHLFHAGSAADVFKHVILTRLLDHLCANPKPWCYLDTHAGIADYDLEHEWARKNAEYRDGIVRLLAAGDPPPAIAAYLDLVRAANAGPALRHYPGSPALARCFLRAGDRMVLGELNPEDHAILAARFRRDRAVEVHEIDAYRGLKAFLPPAERRGLVLIDPPFDRAQEFEHLASAIGIAHKRWASGMYAIWYPLMGRSEIERFERSVQATGIRKILRLELALRPHDWTSSLRGSALLIINPPWRLDEQAPALLAWLWQTLSPNAAGGWRVEWLVPE